MILIADSGSTKTDWRLVKPEKPIQQARCAGFNPFYQTENQIVEELEKVLAPQVPYTEILEIFYYGAGCSTLANRQVVERACRAVFPNLEKIEVQTDLLGAARALCGRTEGIACILGTGSNAAFYDGEEIAFNLPNLGFILGDEGSGAYLGKRLIQDFLHNEMPENILTFFQKRYALNRELIVENVYKKPFPNRYLANYAKFLFDHLADPYCYRTVYESFTLFFDKTVCKYPNFETFPVHFTGSIAFYFSNILRQVANDKGLVLRNILETPIAGLTLYHLE